MNLDDTHLFLISWANWNNSEYELLGYSSPQYQADYEAGYKPPSRITYPESDYEYANGVVRRLGVQDRTIIKGIYLDNAKNHIEKQYSLWQRDGALRRFQVEFEDKE